MAAASLPQESRMSFREQFRATSSASPLRNGLAFLPTFCPCSQEDLSFANHLDYPGGGTTTALLLFCSSALLLFCSSALLLFCSSALLLFCSLFCSLRQPNSHRFNPLRTLCKNTRACGLCIPNASTGYPKEQRQRASPPRAPRAGIQSK